MTERRLKQIGATGGILFVVLQLVGRTLIQVGGLEPSSHASTEQIVEFFEARDTSLFNLGSYLKAVSVIPLLGFLAVLRGVLRRAEGEAGWLTLVATGAGLLFLALVAEGGFWQIALFRVDGLDPHIARLLFDLGNFSFAMQWVMVGTLAFSVGVIGIRFGALPAWLSWLGIALGISLVVARLFWASDVAVIPYTLFWAWLVALSVLVFRRAGAHQDLIEH